MLRPPRLRRRQSGVAALSMGYVVLAFVVVPAAQATSPAGSQFVSVPPTRAYDSGSAPIGQTPVPVLLAGTAGIPADATAVTVNVEVSAPTAAGYVRVTPFGQDAGVASQEFDAGETTSALVTVGLSSERVQVLVSAGHARVLMDVEGYYTSGSGSVYRPVATARAYDSGSVPVGSTPVSVMLAGTAGIPADATAVVVNTEVYGPTNRSYVRVTPDGDDAVVATQEFGAGQTVSNLAVVALNSGRVQVNVHAGTARVLMDVEGYYTDAPGSAFVPLATARVFDSRTVSVGSTPVPVELAGVAGVPANASAVVVNVEVFAPTDDSYVRLTSYRQDAPVATQEFKAGQNISNLVLVKLSAGRAQISIRSGKARVLLDVAGYYGPEPAFNWSTPANIGITGNQFTDYFNGLACAPGTASCSAVGTGYADAINRTPAVFTIGPGSAHGPVGAYIGGLFLNVGCGSTALCAATLSTNNVVSQVVRFGSGTTSGHDWTVDDVDPDGDLTGIACSATAFCIAVDQSGDAFVFSGGAWSSASDIDGNNLLESVSCASPSFCVAGDSVGQVITYNGTTWSAPQLIDSQHGRITSLTCPTAAMCLAVDGQHLVSYNGSHWASIAGFPSGFLFGSVSCPTDIFCAATGGAGQYLTYNGLVWSSPITISSGQDTTIACASSEFCVATGTQTMDVGTP